MLAIGVFKIKGEFFLGPCGFGLRERGHVRCLHLLRLESVPVEALEPRVRHHVGGTVAQVPQAGRRVQVEKVGEEGAQLGGEVSWGGVLEAGDALVHLSEGWAGLGSGRGG